MNTLISTALLASCITAATDNPKNKKFTTWSRCATEGGVCNCAEGGKIGYGDPKWVKNGRKRNDKLVVKKSESGTLRCTNQVFTDPKVGTKKACWCKTPKKTEQIKAKWAGEDDDEFALHSHEKKHRHFGGNAKDHEHPMWTM